MTKAKRLESVLPWLYLKGVSTNDFVEALRALFGESVKGLSPPTIARLKRGWETEYTEWRRGTGTGMSMSSCTSGPTGSTSRYAAISAAACWSWSAVMCGGNKHFLAIEEGFRESTESWRALLLSLRDREQLADVIAGVKFIDGIDERTISRKKAA